jgi:hypothetical protein
MNQNRDMLACILSRKIPNATKVHNDNELVNNIVKSIDDSSGEKHAALQLTQKFSFFLLGHDLADVTVRN